MGTIETTIIDFYQKILNEKLQILDILEQKLYEIEQKLNMYNNFSGLDLAPEKKVTATTARELLGITEKHLDYLIKNGLLPQATPHQKRFYIKDIIVAKKKLDETKFKWE